MDYRVFSSPNPPLDYRKHAVAASTFDVYRKEALAWAGWARARGHDLSSSFGVDHSVMQYLSFIHPVRGKGACTNTVYGIIFFYPELGKKLFLSKQTLKGIGRVQPSIQTPPMSWDVMLMMSQFLVMVYGFRYGAALVVGHHCLLRVNELLGLVTTDVFNYNTTMIIHLRKTKTGINQSVEVEDQDVARLIRVLVRCTPRGKPLFPFRDYNLRTAMKTCCDALKITTNFTPHSLRTGGSTEHWLKYRDLERLRVRGRWLSVNSVRRYVQSARMVQLLAKVPQKWLALGQEYTKLGLFMVFARTLSRLHRFTR